MMRVGLRERLVGAVLIVLTGLLAVTAVLVTLRAERALADAQRVRFTSITRQLAEALRYGVLARSEALLAPQLDVFARTPDLVQIEVRDEGRALLAVRRGASGPLSELRDRQDVVEIALPITTLAKAPGDESGDLALFGLASGPPRRIGSLRAIFSTASMRAIQRRLRLEIVAAFAFLGALGLLAVYALASSVVRRTLVLAHAASRVAADELHVRVDEDGHDELSDLARHFNAMTTALADQRCALDQAAERLAEQESLSAIGRATAVIAHEIKNPLGILLGAAQIASNEHRPHEARIKALHIIREEVQRLERSLDDLLQYARPQRASRQAVDLAALCQRVAARATHPGGPAESLRIELPSLDLSALVDEQHAERIVLNLLINAAQAGASRVEIALRRRDGRVELSVQDDGPGMDPQIREQLFRPFVTTKQRGAGLGLAGSRRLARDNGGDLRLEDSPRGARFVLRLEAAPLMQDKAPEQETTT